MKKVLSVAVLAGSLAFAYNALPTVNDAQAVVNNVVSQVNVLSVPAVPAVSAPDTSAAEGYKAQAENQAGQIAATANGYRAQAEAQLNAGVNAPAVPAVPAVSAPDTSAAEGYKAQAQGYNFRPNTHKSEAREEAQNVKADTELQKVSAQRLAESYKTQAENEARVIKAQSEAYRAQASNEVEVRKVEANRYKDGAFAYKTNVEY
jgi:hypothetical protein